MSELSQMRQEDVLPLIVSQLAEYGYAQLAQVVAEQTHSSVTIKPSPRLSEMLFIAQEESVEIEPTDHSKLQRGATSGAMEEEEDDDDDDDEDEEMQDATAGVSGTTESSEGDTNTFTKTKGGKRPVMTRLNLDTDPKSSHRTKGPNLKTVYTTTHKEPVTCTTFSKDGRYAASGSADTSLKILDVNKMKLVDHDGGNDVHPVIRTLYDHTTPVTDCDFHPNGLVLAASSDTVVKLYDLSKPSVKRSFRYLQDSHPINSVSFHPSGDFLLVGSESETVRIYDVKTLQCFTPKAFSAPPPPPTNRQSGADDSAGSAAAAQHQHQVQQQGPHRGGINHIEYAPTGSVFISASQDGSIKVWDAISGKAEKQSTVFSYNEDYVFSSDESNNTIVCWDARSGNLVKRYAGHQGLIRSVAASPTENAIISCGDDNRARYWCTPAASATSAAAAAAANAQRHQGQGHQHRGHHQGHQHQGSYGGGPGSP
ncbi:cleavage stimulation factor, 3' pre-RNA, subunit 1 [Haplosporangium gracile]|nr:cleavage stimulation factor, 3' pre-RNA, subunit 1 [Haplosporangium gracile]